MRRKVSKWGLIMGAVVFAASCGGGEESISGSSSSATTISDASTVAPTPSTTAVETTTTTTLPEEACETIPDSPLALNIETDLSDEQIQFFMCGLHVAANETDVGVTELSLSMFDDMGAMKESIERLLPGTYFENSAAAQGFYGLIGNDVIFWNYPNTADYRDDGAFVFRVGTHELFHVAQSKMMYGGFIEPAPAWLSEGAAEYFALEMLEKYGFDEHLEWWRSMGDGFVLVYSPTAETFRIWETFGPYPPELPPFLNYPLVARMVGLLAEVSSKEAVLEGYWRERSPDESWEETFTRVFGLTVDEFYALIDEELE